MQTFLGLMIVFLIGLGLSGCMSAREHVRNVHSPVKEEQTLGIVQKEIKAGMSQADVATALGSPNIVSRDGDGKETWIYDKVAREASYSDSAYGGGIFLFGGSAASGASSTTQKTLTVVIKYNEKSLVDSVRFHSSRF